MLACPRSLRTAVAAVREKIAKASAYLSVLGAREYQSEMSAEAEGRILLENRLRAAFKAGELYLVYQPMVSSASGKVVGAEALLRWRHPEMGMVSPDRFIPAAEHIGLIIPLTEWVLREAGRTARTWRERCGETLRMAVNVSSQSFRNTAIIDLVREVMTDNQMPPGSLELEITERVMIDDTAETRFIMEELSRMGVRLSIDDFGTGYSSLSYLKRFPFDTLKIDKSFVQGVAPNGDGSAIVTAIIAMAKSLGLETVGEGVELGGQQDFLKQEGCDVVQGYLLGRPMALDAVLALAECGGVMAAEG